MASAPLSTARVSGYGFGAPLPAGGWTGTGENFGWTRHLGSDIGTKAGEPIVAAFGGTAKFQSGVEGYGNLLTETFDNGWSFLFGHVAGGVSGQVQEGQRIGTTGANVGSAKGSVTLFEVHDPQGRAVNPDPYLKSLVSGKASAQSLFGDRAGSIIGGATGSLVGSAAATTGSVAGDLGGALGQLSGSIAGIPAGVEQSMVAFFDTESKAVREWLGKQAIAFFVAAIVLLVLFWGTK